MPYYSTSQNAQNPGMAGAANALAKIFVGDPAADAEYKNQQIKNETEYLRQKQLQEQTISEAVRRKTMEAQAAASYASAGAANALAGGRNRENKAHVDMGALFTQDHRNFNASGGMSQPGDAPAGTPGAGFNMADPATAAKVVSLAVTGGMDPKTLAPIAMMPGQSDETLGRIMTGTGNTLGKDEYVGTGDRNTNRRFDVGAGSRLVGSDGNVITGVDPSYAAAQTALAGQRNASAARGGKIPKLDQKEMNRFIRESLLSHGANFDVSTVQPSQYLSPQPEVYGDLSQLIDASYSNSGGRASAVQDALAQYFNGQDFSKFGTAVDNPGLFTGDTIQTIQRPDVQAIIASLFPQTDQAAAPAIDPTMFTGGAGAPLPARQNVGNTGWKVLGVQPGGQ